MKLGVRKLQEAIINTKNMDKFDSFAEKLLDVLKSSVDATSHPKTSRALLHFRERMWTNYTVLRCTTLPSIWSEFVESVGCGSIADPLLYELVSHTVFEGIVKETYAAQRKIPCSFPAVLCKEEENIIRYVCGFVAMKLSHRFRKQQGEKAAIFVECLANMSVEGPESSLLDYTKEWMARINRGGLFDISDEGYSLFVAIELALRDKLTQHLHHSAVSGQRDLQASKGSIIDTVSADPEVEFRWTFVSLDIEDEVVGTQLLKHVVELWLTIRGYAISSSWMEKYKQVKKTTTKRRKGLRKTLQGDPQTEK